MDITKNADMEVNGRVWPLISLWVVCVMCLFHYIKDRDSVWIYMIKNIFMTSILSSFYNYLYIVVSVNEYNKDEMKEWSTNNICGTYRIFGCGGDDIGDYFYIFFNREDAMAFKLRWL